MGLKDFFKDPIGETVDTAKRIGGEVYQFANSGYRNTLGSFDLYQELDPFNAFSGLTDFVKGLTGAKQAEMAMLQTERLAAKEDKRRAQMLADEQFKRMQDDIAASRGVAAIRRSSAASEASNKYFGSKLGSSNTDSNNFLGL